MTTRTFHTSEGGERLLRIQLVVSTAFAANAADYWTVVARRKRVGQTYGELLGSVTTATRQLAANDNDDMAARVYDDAVGVVLADGEELVATVTKTGSPVDLDDPRLLVTRQMVR